MAEQEEKIVQVVRDSIYSKFIGDGALILLVALIGFASYYQEIWTKIPLMERFAFVPWLLFVFTYYICSKIEQVQGLKKEKKELARKNYYFTLYWIVLFLPIHYAYIPFEIDPSLLNNSFLNWLSELYFVINDVNLAIGNLPIGRMTTFWQFLGLAVATFGVFRAASGRIHLNGYWAFDVYDYGENNKLVKTGPYENVRHPIYQGQNFLVLGTAMVSTNILMYVFLVIVFALNWVRAKVEEEELIRMFPAEYSEYSRSTYFFGRAILF